MAGNSSRRGAKRNPGSKKGATVGTGGQRRKGLQGKGPTPKATERTSHPAARRAQLTQRAASKRGETSKRPTSRTTSPGARGADTGPETVSGRNPVVEALRAGVPATALYIAERIDSDDRVRESRKLATEARVPVLEAARSELDRLSGPAPHQGMVLQVPAYDYAHPDDFLVSSSAEPPLVVALDGITDPRNLGAVLRSAAAFGGDGVVVPARRAAGVTVTTWKASAGAAARLPVARATNLTRALESYRTAGFFVVGLAAGGSTDVADLEVSDGPLVLVVGSEGKGLSRLVRETCDVIANIPIAATTESLNAGVAAAIALYEVARTRRRTSPLPSDHEGSAPH